MDAQGQDLGHLGQKVDIDRQMLFDEWKEWNEYIRRYTSQLITMTSIVIPAWLLLVGYALAQIDDSILKIVMLAVAGGIALGMIIEFTLSIRLVGKWSERFRSIEDALGLEHLRRAHLRPPSGRIFPHYERPRSPCEESPVQDRGLGSQMRHDA